MNRSQPCKCRYCDCGDEITHAVEFPNNNSRMGLKATGIRECEVLIGETDHAGREKVTFVASFPLKQLSFMR